MNPTTVTFEVYGATLDDLDAEAAETLERLSPDTRWNISLDVRPIALTGAGEAAAWAAEVTATSRP